MMNAIECEIVPTPKRELRIWDRRIGMWRILSRDDNSVVIPAIVQMAIMQIVTRDLDVMTVDNGDGTYTHTFK